jgi:hypothetical protein
MLTDDDNKTFNRPEGRCQNWLTRLSWGGGAAGAPHRVVRFGGRCGDSHADVAELVDALVSGTSGSNVVGVQVSPSALKQFMILLKISNASELVASKIGKFLESLTPDGLDQTTVEDAVISKLIENLRAEGLKGEVAAVRGIDLDAKQLVLDETTKVRRHDHF